MYCPWLWLKKKTVMQILYNMYVYFFGNISINWKLVLDKYSVKINQKRISNFDIARYSKIYK